MANLFGKIFDFFCRRPVLEIEENDENVEEAAEKQVEEQFSQNYKVMITNIPVKFSKEESLKKVMENQFGPVALITYPYNMKSAYVSFKAEKDYRACLNRGEIFLVSGSKSKIIKGFMTKH